MAPTTLRADPTQARQLAIEGALLLWRDAAGGERREGLVLATDVCANPEWPERHIGVEALRVGGDLVAVEVDGREVATPGRNDPCPCGSGRKYEKCCLAAA